MSLYNGGGLETGKGAGIESMSRGQILSEVLFLTLLILHTFAGYAFCHLLFLQFRQYRLGILAWGAWTWRALTLVFAIHYFNQMWKFLSFTLSDGRGAQEVFAVNLAHIVTRPLIGPLFMQLFYVTERKRLPEHWLWQAIIRAAWAITVPIALVRGLWILGVRMPWANLPNQLLIPSDGILLAGGVFSVVIIWKSRRPSDSAFRRRRWQWYLAILSVQFTFMILQLAWRPFWFDTLVEFLPPLAFVLVTVYYGERLTFFDVFAKRGLFFLIGLAVLTGYFALISPHLAFRRLVFVQSWMTALALIPLVFATPWLYAKLNSWIDRSWLGRRFSLASTAEIFSENLRNTANEPDLFECSEASLSYIFQSKACVDSGDGACVARETGEMRANLRVDGADWGMIRILPRPDEVPFLSEDNKLLASLAKTLGDQMEVQRQRDQTLGLQQREQQLVVSAAQSELKALRAQINPHFLFNTLNTIAALIPQKPERAEQTVERLAEVFRYTVRRSDREWVSVAEEIEVVRSYLEIEQMRFGERLQVRIDVETGAQNIRIPAMVIQTLAENAIKHGIAQVRGLGVITIAALLVENNKPGDGEPDGVRLGDRLLVRVSDNGPGLDRTIDATSLPGSSSGGGYGLKNIQERLCAHYGGVAALRFGRDTAAATTVVSFEIPAAAAIPGSG